MAVGTDGRTVLIHEKTVEHAADVSHRWWVGDGLAPGAWQQSREVSAVAFGSGLRLLVAEGRVARLWDAGAAVVLPLTHAAEVT
ncbi:MAG: hypothetical protein K2V38_04690, partial [Gemmataceae bacterium]|nr:hypothetical protein [Gemmataceae bacterium]